MRYTESKLQKIAVEMLEDIDKETVDYTSNYDERLKEPTVLPSKIPNLLVNGSYGIAVGMACNIPPHNLKEVINGICALIDNEEITDEELIEHVKGPDFPTGGIILGREGIYNAYKTGRGKVTLRARAEIEEDAKGRFRIIVSEIPYQVNKAALIENIARQANEKTIEGISDIRDESDRSGLRMVIELKRDANPNVVLNLLYKHTQLQTTVSMLMLALVDNEPKVLALREILTHYINHRKEIVTRRTKFELKKAEARLHILEGLKIALDNIDEIVSIIRNAKNDQEAKNNMMDRFTLTDIQAQAILDMRLKTLTGLQREKIENEYNELLKAIAHFKDILSNVHLVMEIIKEELTEITEKYGDERKTEITNYDGEIDIESLIKEEENVITLTHMGYIKRISLDAYRSQKRGGRGSTGMNTREEDFVKHLFVTSTHNYIMFFTTSGKVYRLKAYELPETSKTAKGTAIVNLLQLEPGDKIAAVIPIKSFDEDLYVLIATKSGMIKKTKIEEYSKIRKSGIQSISLKEDDNIVDVRITDGNSDIVMVSQMGLAIRFDERDVRCIGRTGMGVIGMRLNKGDFVIGMEQIIDKKDYILAITENGFGKRTEIDDYRKQVRGGKGISTYKITPKTGKIVGIKIVNSAEDVMLVTDTGIVIRLHVKDISVIGRSTQGVTLMRTSEGGKVISFAKVDQNEE